MNIVDQILAKIEGSDDSQTKTASAPSSVSDMVNSLRKMAEEEDLRAETTTAKEDGNLVAPKQVVEKENPFLPIKEKKPKDEVIVNESSDEGSIPVKQAEENFANVMIEYFTKNASVYGLAAKTVAPALASLGIGAAVGKTMEGKERSKDDNEIFRLGVVTGVQEAVKRMNDGRLYDGSGQGRGNLGTGERGEGAYNAQ